MSSREQAECTRAQVREAAVWMTLLRSPDRTAKIERGFRRWLTANSSHAAAFEKVSTAWEATGALPRGPFPRLSRWQRAGFRQGFLQAATAVVSLAVVTIIGAFIYQRGAGVSTEIGEQRMLTLQDGTRVYLNTDTRVVVNYQDRQRAVELKSGEALFEVAKKPPDWPFVVTVDGRQITALGTAFVVRRDPARVLVTLVEGKVTVQPTPASVAPMIALSPGQRLTLADNKPPQMDEPSIEKVTAWRSGHVDLVEMSLADAVAEMNRYSRIKVTVTEPEAAALPVYGTFRAGDITSFANAVADSYGLEVIDQTDRIVLQGKPQRRVTQPD